MTSPDIHLQYSKPFERGVDLLSAKSSLEESLKQLRLTIEVKSSGQLFKTFKCNLRDASGKVLDYGFGKGDPISAEIGAVFEASEHWFSQFKNANAHHIKYADSLVYASNASLPNALLLDIIQSSPQAVMALREYKSLSGGDVELLPVALSSPKYIDERYETGFELDLDKFDYGKIESYSSNSGIAIGSNEVDATIHGLLEVVERDTISEFLVNVFLLRNPDSVRIVHRSSIPADINYLMEMAEAEVCCEIILHELTNKFQIPCYCTTLKQSRFEIEVVGYGCSLSREHAARRSIHELVQCFHITTLFHPAEFREKNHRILSRFSRHPFHLRCAKMKIHEWCKRIGYVAVDFSENNELKYPEENSAYLRQVVDLIEEKGHKVFSSVLSILPSGETVVHSVFERQENFFIATEGGFVLPDESRWANHSFQRTAAGGR